MILLPSRAPGSSSEVVWNVKIHFLTWGVGSPPLHSYTSQYCRRDKRIRYRITILINYKQSGCKFFSMLPFCTWMLGSQFWSHWPGEMSLKAEELPQRKTDRRASLPWHLQLPPQVGWWRPASPRLEHGLQGKTVWRAMWAVFISYLIWSPYVSYFQENLSVYLFLV